MFITSQYLPDQLVKLGNKKILTKIRLTRRTPTGLAPTSRKTPFFKHFNTSGLFSIFACMINPPA